jgi:hypothetical protein
LIVAVAPDEQYQKLIAVMTVRTNENFSTDNFQLIMWSIIVLDLIDSSRVCEEN